MACLCLRLELWGQEEGGKGSMQEPSDEELAYLLEERIGINCGVSTPTKEQLEQAGMEAAEAMKGLNGHTTKDQAG